MGGASFRVMLLLLLTMTLLGGAVAGESKRSEFSIRPSIDDKVSVAAGDYECTFAWTDCTGGSSEQWEIKLTTGSDGKTPECLVGRPCMSYLTFLEWKAELKGAKDA